MAIADGCVCAEHSLASFAGRPSTPGALSVAVVGRQAGGGAARDVAKVGDHAARGGTAASELMSLSCIARV